MFSAMHEMRTKGYSPAQAIEAALNAAIDVRVSERAAVGEIAGMFADLDFSTTGNEREIAVRPAAAQKTESLFSLA